MASMDLRRNRFIAEEIEAQGAGDSLAPVIMRTLPREGLMAKVRTAAASAPG